MKQHLLQTWPTYWDALATGEKTFEIRRNDRFFQKGDVIICRRLLRDEAGSGFYLTLGKYSELHFTILSVLQGGQFGIEAGFCVLSIKPMPTSEDPTP